MLKLNTSMRPPSIQERADIMRRNITKGGVPIDYDRLIEYLAHSRVEQDELGVKLLRLTNSNDSHFSTRTFKDWIKKNNIYIGFNVTEKGNLSLNDESITNFLNTNAYGDEISNVVKTFKLYNYYVSQVSALPRIIESIRPSGLESADGRRVVLVKPGVETQNTGRFGLVNPALMNLPRYMKDLVVAPKGWRILSADSGQIEPKLIYGFYLPDRQIQKLIEVYGDAYYAVLHYCRMPYEDIKNQVMEFTPFEITPELKELRQKLKTYGNGVMYGSTYNPENDPLKQAYIERIGQHPLRIEWQRKLEAKLMSGQRVFETLFGTPIDVYKSDKYAKARTEKEKQLALQHCIINNPVQGSAGDLMGFSLAASDKLLREKAPNSWITKFVHDEGQYCIYEGEYDYVIEELSGHTAYDIDGVVQIFNEPKIGRTFNEAVPMSYKHLLEGGK